MYTGDFDIFKNKQKGLLLWLFMRKQNNGKIVVPFCPTNA